MTAGFDRLTTQLVAALRGRLTGKPLPRVPEAGLPLWGAFCELSARRTWHAHGPNPIAYSEIEAWARLMRWPLEPRHVEAILALDDVWLEHSRKQVDKPEEDKAVSDRPMTPAIFDATMG